MFCCTLIALLFSQPALAFGAIKARLFGSSGTPAVASNSTRQWRTVMAFGLISLDVVILATGLHFLTTISAASWATFAHICGFSR